MRKHLKYVLPSLLILGLAGSLALAQTINKALQLSQDATGVFSVDSFSGVYFPGHILSTVGGSRPLPVLSACITGGTPGISGTDFSGVVTAGSTASTSCVVTFGTPYLTAPNCVVSWQTGPLAAMSWTTSTTALTLTQTSTGSTKIAYVCTAAS